jgi:hypothetical protein
VLDPSEVVGERWFGRCGHNGFGVATPVTLSEGVS